MGLHDSFLLDDIFYRGVPGFIEENGGWGSLWEEQDCFQSFIENSLCFFDFLFGIVPSFGCIGEYGYYRCVYKLPDSFHFYSFELLVACFSDNLGSYCSNLALCCC